MPPVKATLPFSARSYNHVICRWACRSCQPSDVPTKPADRASQPVEQAEGEGAAIALGKQHRAAVEVPHPCRVVAAVVGEVRREQHEQAVVAGRAGERREARALEQDRAARVGDDLLLDPVAVLRAGVHQPVGRDPLEQAGRLVPRITLLLGEEVAAVGHDQPEVSRAGLVHAREVDLVEDAVAQREPHRGCPERARCRARSWRWTSSGDRGRASPARR